MFKRDEDRLRQQMVEAQLLPRGIKDQRVLGAFRKVQRHLFVPGNLRELAYDDHPLPIGYGQTISQPYMVALMTQLLGLGGEERVLEIGTGSGYQCAILAELAKEVYSVEKEAGLAQDSARALESLGYNNVKIKQGDGTLGWQEYAPYDGIVVTAGAPSIPAPLLDQLNEGGRLVIPVGSDFSQMLKLVRKQGGRFLDSDECPCVFVPLVGKYGWSQ